MEQTLEQLETDYSLIRPTPPHLECHSTEVNWVAVAYLCRGHMIPGDIYNLGMKRILVFMSWALRKIGFC